MTWWQHFIWKIIYPLVGKLASAALPVFGTKKIKEWFKKRKLIRLTHSSPKLEQKSILFFCPSMGEFESIKSIARQFNKKEYFVEITFFSPSGYEGAKSYVDLYHRISYSPVDIKEEVRLFFEHRNPDLIVISTLAIWPTLLTYAFENRIPFYFVGVHLNQNLRKKIYLQSLDYLLKVASGISTIDSGSKEILAKIGIDADCDGDPRIDSIQKDLEFLSPDIQLFKQYISNKKVLICGSSYSNEEEIILKALGGLKRRGFSIIIAPHNIDRAHQIKSQFSEFTLYSEINFTSFPDFIILDKIGLLKHLYQFADITFIGGGLSHKLHNIAEPMISESVVCFGPNYKNSLLAIEWSQLIPEAVISNERDFIHFIELTAMQSNLHIKRENLISKHKSNITSLVQKIIKSTNHLIGININ